MKEMRQLRLDSKGETRVLYHMNYWDGPISGVCLFNGKKCYFDTINEVHEERLMGVDNPNKMNIIKLKISKSNLDKYGKHPSKLKLTQDKIKSTNLKKYGVECVFQSKEIREKIKFTNLKKYGVEYISQNPEIYESKILSGFRIKKHECGLTYQGTYELDFINFCISNNIEISKPPSFLYEMNGEKKRYYPDFFIEKYNLIIEVKSSYYYNLHKEKNELKKELIINNGINYLLILDKDYSDFLKSK